MKEFFNIIDLTMFLFYIDRRMCLFVILLCVFWFETRLDGTSVYMRNNKLWVNGFQQLVADVTFCSSYYELIIIYLNCV